MYCETEKTNDLVTYLQTLSPGSEFTCASKPIVLRHFDINNCTVTLEFPSLNPKSKKGHLVKLSVHRFSHYLSDYI